MGCEIPLLGCQWQGWVLGSWNLKSQGHPGGEDESWQKAPPNHYNNRSTITFNKHNVKKWYKHNDTIQLYILRFYITNIYYMLSIQPSPKGYLISLPVLSTRRTRTTLQSFFTKVTRVRFNWRLVGGVLIFVSFRPYGWNKRAFKTPAKQTSDKWISILNPDSKKSSWIGVPSSLSFSRCEKGTSVVFGVKRILHAMQLTPVSSKRYITNWTLSILTTSPDFPCRQRIPTYSHVRWLLGMLITSLWPWDHMLGCPPSQ